MNRGLLLTSALAVSRSITGCFVQQNIGEVSARTEGLENTGNGSDRVKPPPMPCPVALRGVSVREYRGSARRARGLNPTIKNSYGILQLFS